MEISPVDVVLGISDRCADDGRSTTAMRQKNKSGKGKSGAMRRSAAPNALENVLPYTRMERRISRCAADYRAKIDSEIGRYGRQGKARSDVLLHLFLRQRRIS
jgi:hypothetical protein